MPQKSKIPPHGDERAPISSYVSLLPKRPPLDVDRAVQAYVVEGRSIGEVAKELGYTRKRVRQVLRALGIESRKRPPPDYHEYLLEQLWYSLVARADGRAGTRKAVKLDPAWREYEAFAAFARSSGWKPGLVLARLGPEEGYVPSNVQFVTPERMNEVMHWIHAPRPQRMLTAFGETKGYMQWVADPRCRVKERAFRRRLDGGMSVEAALTTPPRPGNHGTSMLPHDPKPRGVRRLDPERVRSLYLGGASPVQIAKQLKTYPTVIRRALARLGIPLRPRSNLTSTGEGRLLHKVWYAMRSRCSNPRDRNFALQGGRGVRVFPPWQTFEVFYRWAKHAGWPPGLFLKRIDDDGDYRPDNCRFESAEEGRKRPRAPRTRPPPKVLVTAFGETKRLTDWTKDPRCKVGEAGLSKRLRGGMHPEEAITKPSRRGPVPGQRFLTAFGETKSQADWLRDPRCKVTAAALRLRLKSKMPVEEALTTPPWGRRAPARGLRGTKPR